MNVPKRQLGKNGPAVSAIAMGSRLAVNDLKQHADAKDNVIKTLQHGMDVGINFINTADFYDMGLNELIIGEAIKDRREQAFISVKTGTLRDHNGQFLGLDNRPNAIKNFCAYSLTRLGVDHIDLYEPARMDPQVPIEETVGAIKDLIAEGKVRYLGLSEANSEIIRRAHKVHPVAALEIEYSLATRFIEKDILPTCRELGIAVVPYSVLSYGLLTGNMQFPLPANNYLAHFPRFQEQNMQKNLVKVDILKDMAEQKGVSASQLALAWILHQGEDIIPIVGMSKPKRVEQNLLAFDIKFSEQELQKLDKVFAIGAMAGGRYPDALMQMVPS